jgi:hypothetical protein
LPGATRCEACGVGTRALNGSACVLCPLNATTSEAGSTTCDVSLVPPAVTPDTRAVSVFFQASASRVSMRRFADAESSLPAQLSFAADAVAAAAWPVTAGVPGAAAADVLAPLVRTDCAAAFCAAVRRCAPLCAAVRRCAPLSAVTLALALDQGAAASARRRLATARPTVLLHVNVTVLLVPLLPGDSTAAEIQVRSRMPFR